MLTANSRPVEQWQIRLDCLCEDRQTHRQESLRTKDKSEAARLLNAKDEARENPLLNRQIARTYLAAVDPDIVKRCWRYTLEELIKTKFDENARRWRIFSKDRAIFPILDLPLIETRAEHFLGVLNAGTEQLAKGDL
jgi:hypothetical protein